jgi:hypothetical protein
MPIVGPDPIEVLGRLFRILHRSFAEYQAGADPWGRNGDAPARRALEHLVTDQRMYAGRIAELIIAERGRIDNGDFPMEFTEYNLLSIGFLLKELTRRQRDDIARIEQCVAQLSNHLPSRVLAEEILGNARGHLETLEELLRGHNDGAVRLATP